MIPQINNPPVISVTAMRMDMMEENHQPGCKREGYRWDHEDTEHSAIGDRFILAYRKTISAASKRKGLWVAITKTTRTRGKGPAFLREIFNVRPWAEIATAYPRLLCCAWPNHTHNPIRSLKDSHALSPSHIMQIIVHPRSIASIQKAWSYVALYPMRRYQMSQGRWIPLLSYAGSDICTTLAIESGDPRGQSTFSAYYTTLLLLLPTTQWHQRKKNQSLRWMRTAFTVCVPDGYTQVHRSTIELPFSMTTQQLIFSFVLRPPPLVPWAIRDSSSRTKDACHFIWYYHIVSKDIHVNALLDSQKSTIRSRRWANTILHVLYCGYANADHDEGKDRKHFWYWSTRY